MTDEAANRIPPPTPRVPALAESFDLAAVLDPDLDADVRAALLGTA